MKTKKIIKLNIFSKKKMKDKIKNHLWDAFETLRIKTSLNDLEAFKAVFTLYAFKHLSDRNDLTGDYGWYSVINKPVEDLFVEIEKILMCIDDLKVEEAVGTLNLTQLNNKIPKDIKEFLINFFSGINLASEGEYRGALISMSSLEVVDNLLTRFIKKFSLYNPDFFESISLNRLVIALIKPHEYHLNIHFPEFKTGQILIEAANYIDKQYGDELIPPDKEEEYDPRYHQPNIKVTVSNKDLWAICYLIHSLVEHRSHGYWGTINIDIKLSNYFLKNTHYSNVSSQELDSLRTKIKTLKKVILERCCIEKSQSIKASNTYKDKDLKKSLIDKVNTYWGNIYDYIVELSTQDDSLESSDMFDSIMELSIIANKKSLLDIDLFSLSELEMLLDILVIINKSLAKERTLDWFILEQLKKVLDIIFNEISININEYAIFFVSPFGTSLPSDDDLTLSLNGRVFEFLPDEPELFYLIRGINHLHRRGRLAVVLPAYALSKKTGNYKKVREFIVNEDLLEVIVQLPKGIFPHIKEQLVLLQINTNKEENRRRKIAFIKTDGTMQEGIKEITDPSIKRAVYVCEKFTSVSDDRIVFIKDVQQKDYNLTPSLYLGNTTEELKKMIRAKTVRRLGDICKVIEGQYVATSYKAKGIPVISTNSLCKDIKDLYLKLDDLSYIDPKSHPETIKDKCIIVSVFDNEIKPTIFDPKTLGHKEIVLEKGVAAIFPDESLVDFDYLYYQLNSRLIKTQYEEASICRDEFNRSIFPQLKKIVIPLPEKIEEQRSFAYQQKIDLINAEDAQNQALRETLRLKDEKKEAEFQIVKHLGHSLNHRINNVQIIISELEKFINRKGLDKEPLQEIYYEGQEEIIVKDKIKEALNDLRQMHKLISGTRDIVTKAITQKDFVHTNVKKLFENKILHKYHGHNFKINFNCADNVEALIHESSFIEAFDNIIRNAEEHGFKDKKVANEIYFWIHDDKDIIIIDYANNGVPFPHDMREEDFLAFGVKGKSSNGSGLGGAYVKLMLEAHNGDFEIMRKPKKLLAINEYGEFFIEEDRGFLKYAVYFRFIIPKRRKDEQEG